jgi:flagellar protein FlgJ
MSPLAAPTLAGMSLTATHGSDREKLAAAAKQFEAIFIRQMLGAARKASFGEGLFGGQAMQTFRQMQDEKFADIAAERGAFGMAKLIEAQLSAQAGGK